MADAETSEQVTTETPAAEETHPTAPAQEPQSEETGPFREITSQRQLDQVIAKRLERERAKFADYAELQEKAAAIDDAIERAEKAEAALADLKAANQVRDWREEVAAEAGVPAAALRGSTRKELEEHAAQLKELIATVPGPQRVVVPGEGEPDLALNGNPLLDKLKAAVGAK